MALMRVGPPWQRKPSPTPRAHPAQADAEPVDPKPRIEKECHSSCTGQWDKYQACIKRITKKGRGTCEPWAFDYWACIDKCAAPRIFAQLK